MADQARLTRDQWLVLIAAFLGWMFDGVEMGLFPIVARPALQDLLRLADDRVIGPWNGYLAATFLLGAAAGGLVFGWMGDRIGRVRSMAISILAYSAFTGACFFATAPWQLGALRFLGAVGMGGQWSLGVSLVMECWPERHRPILAGVIGAANNVGLLLIAAVGWAMPITTENWRWMMLAGLAPGLLAVFVILFVPESQRWKRSLTDAAARINPLRAIFTPPLLRSTLLAILFSSVTMIGTWAAATSFGPLWTDRLTEGKMPHAKAVFQFAFSGGAILGCLLGPLLGSRMGRRPAYFLLNLAALAACQILFLSFHAYSLLFVAMVFVTGVAVVSFYGFLPLYLPELYPTRVRAVGTGLTYNSGRILAAAGALTTGQMVSLFGGNYGLACAAITLVYLVGMAAVWLAPETKGKPLPD